MDAAIAAPAVIQRATRGSISVEPSRWRYHAVIASLAPAGAAAAAGCADAAEASAAGVSGGVCVAVGGVHAPSAASAAANATRPIISTPCP